MRTIKFRGYGIVEKKWFYGNLVEGNAGRYITDAYYEEGQGDMIRYDPIQTKTIGQFTGLLDKNGKEIYEGDIVKTKGNWGGVVTWNSRGYFYINDGYYTEEPDLLPLGSLNCYVRRDIEIVGNIHDNPELLKNND